MKRYPILIAIDAESLVILSVLLISIVLGIYFFRLLKYQQDIHACEEIIKQNSLTFYKAFSKISNRRQREAVYAVYAFCRYADDLADEHHDLERLNRLEEELRLFHSGKTPDHFMWRAMRVALRPFYRKNTDYQPFYDMIEGQRRDLNFVPYQSLDELKEYCYYVAGTVGLMLIPILSPKHHDGLKDFAIHLGEAMQMTNVLRDIGEDKKMGRIYLPKDLMEYHQISETDLDEGNITSGFVALFEELSEIAKERYASALDEIHRFPMATRYPLGASIVLYRAILDAAKDAGYDVFHQRVFVSDAHKNHLLEQYKSMFTGERK